MTANSIRQKLMFGTEFTEIKVLPDETDKMSN